MAKKSLVIYLLLIAVTDLPPLPVIKIIRYFISKVSAIFKSSSELSPEKPGIITDEPKYNGEGNKLMVGKFKRKMLEDIPFGEIIIEMYENDMKDMKCK